jgi:multidrug efflux pump subunit AcrA (membrane-fusion protein)
LNQSKTLSAKVSNVLPQFDGATRTLKVRLEADNPGYLLRPDMFVDVELPVKFPSTIAVPADAVLDSGRRKTADRVYSPPLARPIGAIVAGLDDHGAHSCAGSRIRRCGL